MEHINKKTGEVMEQLDLPLQKCGYNERGEEVQDSRPMALPVGFSRPKSLTDTMKSLLRNEEFRRALDEKGVETFEEADDFDCGEDDPLGSTPYEDTFDPEHPGAIAREQEIRAGQVADLPIEKKLKAASLAAQVRLERAAYQRRYWQKRRKQAKKEAESDSDHESDNSTTTR